MQNITIGLEKDKGAPLYQQIYAHIAGEIMAGALGRGGKLPSKHALAEHLGVSKNTVEEAYAMLLQEGYIYSRPRSGYYVSAVRYRYDFRTNAVDIPSFPYKLWAKLSREVLYTGADLLSGGDPRGDLCLRESIAQYLHQFRGVQCQPGQIVIGAGVEYLLTLLAALLPEDAVYALENPGYGKTALVLQGAGRQTVPIDLDAAGLPPEALEASGADIAYITPSHQFPTGAILPVGRRSALLAWAAEKPGRYVIEDDYNSEFHFSARPIPAIQGLDTRGRVIYLSTFSRILAPSTRIAYMVLPMELMEAFRRRLGYYSSTVSRFEQHTLTKFIAGGHLARHLNRVKNIYRHRRDLLTTLLRERGGKVSGDGAGIHLLCQLDAPTMARVLENAARGQIRVAQLADYYTGAYKGPPTLVLGYGGIASQDIEPAVEQLFR